MKCIERAVADKLKEMTTIFPFVFLAGPRKSGKSTLLKNLLLKNFEYINLAEIQAQNYSLTDPRGFVNVLRDKVIIDDAHIMPSIIPHIEAKINEKRGAAAYILSGCLDSKMSKNISQFLSGRAVKITLLPFSSSELAKSGRLPKTANEWMLKGNYPELFSSAIDQQTFFHRYTSALVERDIKSKLKKHGFNGFKHFLSIIAANSGNPLNLSKLGEEASIDARTVNSWISTLEEQFILFRLTPYHSYRGKRYTKTPKLYFYDTGLLCFLLGITSAEELNFHPLRSPVFETAVISETAKKYFNAGYKPRMNYWRDLDNNEKEIDLIEESSQKLELTEIKLSQTSNEDYAKNLLEFKPSATGTYSREKTITKQVIYDGNGGFFFDKIRYINWKSLSE